MSRQMEIFLTVIEILNIESLTFKLLVMSVLPLRPRRRPVYLGFIFLRSSDICPRRAVARSLPWWCHNVFKPEYFLKCASPSDHPSQGADKAVSVSQPDSSIPSDTAYRSGSSLRTVLQRSPYCNCVAKPFSYVEMILAAAMLVWSTDLRTADGTEQWIRGS